LITGKIKILMGSLGSWRDGSGRSRLERWQKMVREGRVTLEMQI
jgi:hypothetical protein